MSTFETFLPPSPMLKHYEAINWKETPLGAVENWPQSLRAALSICLSSRYPIIIYWGREFVCLYNEAYAPILGKKHPWGLGRPFRETWAEIWDELRPMLTRVLREGTPTWSDDMLLVLERHGFPEECYFSFSFGSVRLDDGGYGGVFTACTETTLKVVGERRLRTLQDLAARGMEAKTIEAACSSVLEAVRGNPLDLPLFMLYTYNPISRTLEPDGTANFPSESDNWKQVPIPWEDIGHSGFLREAIERGKPAKVPLHLPSPWEGLATGTHKTGDIILQPIVLPAGNRIAGLLVTGLNPLRPYEESYQGFIGLVASQIASAVGNASAHEEDRRRVQALAEINMLKTDFFSNISHEFRTPLTLMLGPIEDALQSGGALVGNNLEMVRRNANRLLKMVNSLLDFSRIEAGRMQAAPEALDLAALTADLAGMFRASAESNGINLVVECPPLSGLFRVDKDMWEKIVLNLLSNAFKFTFSGTIKIALIEEQESVLLRVEDTGVGIPPEELPHIFERFHRVRNVKARTHEGAGIGLALVKELAKLHEGSVSAISRIGHGTTFTVMLPKRHAQAALPAGDPFRPIPGRAAEGYVEEIRHLLSPDPASPLVFDSREAPAPKSSPSRTSGRILLVDDNPDMRAYLIRLLAPHWDVVEAPDGKSALEIALQGVPPDLVLTDIMMPGMDGFQLLHHLRSSSHTSHIPVLMLSARSGEESRVEGLEEGADDYLVKPFSARELVARVSTHIKLTRLRAALEKEKTAHATLERLQHMQKMASIGRLAGGVAHEYNNLMTTVVGYSALSMAQTPEGPLHDNLAQIQKAGDRAADLTRQLLAFSQQLVIQPKIVDLNALILSLRKILERELRGNIPLEFRLEPGVGSVRVDIGQIEQVLLHLILNARDAMPNGGRVSLETSRVELDDEYTARHPAVFPGTYARLTVSDTGIGMDETVKARIFDPFYSTKSLGRGMGLGLSIVHGIIAQSEGYVFAYSEPGLGSTFKIYLPIAGDPQADPPGQSEASPGESRGTETILVVEDETPVRAYTKKVLESRGYKVVEAEDAKSAMQRIRETPDRIHMLLADVILPGMNGRELAQKISKVNPNIKVIFMSGYSHGVVEHHDLLEKEAILIPKPFSPNALARVIRRVLDSKPIESPRPSER